jgi:AAA family ATP:ADP antiporter
MRWSLASSPLREPTVRWAASGFFFLLAGYSLLRPVREEMGIAGGVDELAWTFTATFVTITVAVVPVSWALSRYRRGTVVPGIYAAFALSLVAFWAAASVLGALPRLAQALYVWISTFNMFAVSLFWALLADLSSTDEGKRTFGVISAGGSAGAIAGPLLTASLAEALGPWPLLLLGAGFLVLAAGCAIRIARAPGAQKEPAPQVGSLHEGLVRIVRSRQLLGISAYVVLFTTTSTFLYFEQAHIVEATIADSGARTALFARMDLAVNVLALLMQLFAVAALFRRIGVAWVLASLPLLTIAGFSALHLAPVLVTLVIVQVLRRAANFALAKPARELLFTAVDRTERYKSKVVIDTVVYRGSDAVAAWAFSGLSALGLGLPGIAAVGAGLSVGWTWVARVLGIRAGTSPIPSRPPSNRPAPENCTRHPDSRP